MFSTNQWAWDTQSGAWRADGPAKQARERRLQEDLRPHDWREEQRGHLQVPVVPVPVPIAFMIHRGGDGGLDNTLHWNINNSSPHNSINNTNLFRSFRHSSVVSAGSIIPFFTYYFLQNLKVLILGSSIKKKILIQMYEKNRMDEAFQPLFRVKGQNVLPLQKICSHGVREWTEKNFRSYTTELRVWCGASIFEKKVADILSGQRINSV